jgi:hypothetical protein
MDWRMNTGHLVGNKIHWYLSQQIPLSQYFVIYDRPANKTQTVFKMYCIGFDIGVLHKRKDLLNEPIQY